MSPSHQHPAEPGALDFIVGNGDMARRLRVHPWEETSFGPPAHWSQSLRSALSICLGSSFQIAIYWGQDLALLYNDAWSAILGSKHPWALGRPGREVWPEIWDMIGPKFSHVMSQGEATLSRDQLLAMHRRGFTEECYFDYTFSPIFNEAGCVDGIFNIAVETTFRVIGERRTRLLRDASELTYQARTAADVCTAIAKALASDTADVPFCVIYLADTARATPAFERMACVGLDTDSRAAAQVIGFGESQPTWPVAEAVKRKFAVSVEDLEKRFGFPLPGGPWPEACERALVIPLPKIGVTECPGALVLGISPRLQLDSEYETFLDRVATLTATAIANAQAYEDERKRADSLVELDRAKTLFFSNISHELRTPLTLMLGPLESLLGRPEDFQTRDLEELAIAHRNSLRLLKLVNSLLDFSRIEAGRVKATYAPTDLAAFTAELASNFRSAMQAAGLDLDIQCEALPEPIYVDREMWEKIVLNLLSNAFKFTFDGAIRIRLQGVNDLVVLTVADTGIGISAEELPRIFERFHRIEGARGRTHEGTGIGLALTKELVELHGGRISAASTPGQGSIFTVSLHTGTAHLPKESIVAEPATPASVGSRQLADESILWSSGTKNAPAIPSGLVGTGTKPRILLVDDNPDMREHVTRTLGSEYDVTTSQDGLEAFEEVRRLRPDLVIADIMMPGLDGLGLLAAIRSDPAIQTLPVIFLSARAGEEARVEGLHAGADDYLVKPFTANELRARVATHVKMAIARRQAMEREAALRAEAEAARDQAIAVLESITDGYISLDSRWCVTYVNAEAERLTGVQREQMNGKNYWDLLPSAIGTKIHTELLRAAEKRVTLDFETFFEPWRRWFHIKVYPAPDEGLSVFLEEITVRKLAEISLRESEERFRAIVETTPECVKIVAADGTLLLMNSSGLTMVGAESAEAVVGQNIYPVIAPEFQNAFREFNQKICQGEKGSLDFDIIGLKGERRQMETHAAPLRGPDGMIAQLAITHDVTERKQAERESTLLAAIVDSSDDAIVSKSLDGIVTSWNKGAASLFGYTSEEMVGKPITIIMPPDRLQEEPEILNRIQRGEVVDHFETIRRRKSGELLNISLTISPIRDGRGKIIGASKIARDITNRKQAEEAIRALNEQLTADLSAMTRMQQISTRLVQAEDFAHLLDEIVAAGVAITGADMGNIRLLEDGLLKMVSQRGFDALFPGFLDGVQDDPAARRVTLERPERVIVENIRQSSIFAGTQALDALLAAGMCAVQSTPLIARSGRVLGTFSTYYGKPRRPVDRELRMLDLLARQAADLIERKQSDLALQVSEAKFRQLAEELRGANLDLEQFAYSASHDLQEPLRSIKIYSELLTQRYGGQIEGKGQEFLNYVHQGASQMEMLVRDLLTYTQVTKFDLPADDVDSNEALAAALANLAGAVVESGAEVTADALPSLRVHGAHLTQLFQNLIGNAIKYRSPDRAPVIHVGVAREGKKWIFAVRDNGIGIQPEYKELVFGLFKRLHTGKAYSGTGIGLSICQRIVERYNGRIWIEPAPGGGSIFIFTLPD